MAGATKCRAADDLLLVAENHPVREAALRPGVQPYSAVDADRRQWRALTGAGLSSVVSAGADRRPSSRLARRGGDINALFAALHQILPAGLVEIVQEGYRRSGEVLPIFMALLAPHLRSEFGSVQDDEMPPETMVGPVPGFCVDLYTRPARPALARLIDGPTRTARWVRLAGPVYRIREPPACCCRSCDFRSAMLDCAMPRRCVGRRYSFEPNSTFRAMRGLTLQRK